jgi:uncharacterized protein YecT (DUF1311 family)
MAQTAVMAESTVRGIKKVIQDFVAPEIRDLKGDIAQINTRIDGLEKLMDTQYKALNDKMNAQSKALNDKMDTQFKAIDDKLNGQFKAIMSAIGESKAKGELETFRMISALSERVAVLESARQ